MASDSTSTTVKTLIPYVTEDHVLTNGPICPNVFIFTLDKCEDGADHVLYLSGGSKQRGCTRCGRMLDTEPVRLGALCQNDLIEASWLRAIDGSDWVLGFRWKTACFNKLGGFVIMRPSRSRQVWRMLGGPNYQWSEFRGSFWEATKLCEKILVEASGEGIPSQLSIEKCDFSIRTINLLRKLKVRTLGGVSTHTREELRKIRGFGVRVVNEIEEKLAEHGMALKPS